MLALALHICDSIDVFERDELKKVLKATCNEYYKRHILWNGELELSSRRLQAAIGTF